MKSTKFVSPRLVYPFPFDVDHLPLQYSTYQFFSPQLAHRLNSTMSQTVMHEALLIIQKFCDLMTLFGGAVAGPPPACRAGTLLAPGSIRALRQPRAAPDSDRSPGLGKLRIALPANLAGNNKGVPEGLLHKRITFLPPFSSLNSFGHRSKDLSFEPRLSTSRFYLSNLSSPFAPPLSLASPFRTSPFPHQKPCPKAVLSHPLRALLPQSLLPESHPSPARQLKFFLQPRWTEDAPAQLAPTPRRHLDREKSSHPHPSPPKAALRPRPPAEQVMEVLLNLIIKQGEKQHPAPAASPAPAIAPAGRIASPPGHRP